VGPTHGSVSPEDPGHLSRVPRGTTPRTARATPCSDIGPWKAACDRKTHEQFGGGPLEKYLPGQLASGLPYRTHGFAAEV
jgi:hypothetical protein